MTLLTDEAHREAIAAFAAEMDAGGGWESAACRVADAVLAMLKPYEHRVILTEETFTVMHTLQERFDGTMQDCELFGWLREQPVPPAKPGEYTAEKTTDGWVLAEVAE